MSKPSKSATAKKRATPKKAAAYQPPEAILFGGGGSAGNAAGATSTTRTEHVLEEALRIIQGERRQDYGDVRQSFDQIATGWEVIFGHTITGRQVAQAMIWLKVVRDVNGPKRDNAVDIAGYAGLMEDLEGV